MYNLFLNSHFLHLDDGVWVSILAFNSVRFLQFEQREISNFYRANKSIQRSAFLLPETNLRRAYLN